MVEEKRCWVGDLRGDMTPSNGYFQHDHTEGETRK